MTAKELEHTTSAAQPPAGLPTLLEAMWWEARGNWERAHQVAQDVATPDGAWVHAYLHRAEGDATNAGYWYRQAKRAECKTSLKQEWEAIVETLLQP